MKLTHIITFYMQTRFFMVAWGIIHSGKNGIYSYMSLLFAEVDPEVCLSSC
jgi:hypothetical protein